MASRVIIAAGGTGGHVFPALAIGEEIRAQKPETEILFIGTNRGLEERVIPAAGFRLKTIVMSGVQRSLHPRDVLRNLVMPFKVLFGLLQSITVMWTFRPHVVIGCGGYVTGPIVLLAALFRKKIILQEQNSRPGRTTLSLARWADAIHLTYEDAQRFFDPKRKLMMSGNPLRKGFARQDMAAARAALGLDSGRNTLLVLGGSLGARAVNAALLKIMDTLLQDDNIQVLWQTGKPDYENVRDTMKPYSQVQVHAFIDNMIGAYSAADTVLCRAGAMTLSEITMMGLPAVLVPYPFAADNHQEYNARSLSDRGAAMTLLQTDLNEQLLPALRKMMQDQAYRRAMAEASYALRQPDAAQNIVRHMFSLEGVRA
ncbi:undecaprenyldiphospho-muramoylpentapeptide beta-N-acetylglucosaminyltransferase [bacterium]|nr:undecaprenyldiphospho-muramoylpentapeptide beta-N-acetylglucosaminyltransferase [bacterium]NUN45731.1 undecaprenyldiphospho-muramoylpentapeptide beta-N-acetylglucosaminyltransferase [bacterium]